MAAKTSTTPKKPSSKRPSRAPAAAMGPTTEEIKKRAFELFIARGREHGRAEEDWLNAERELRERYSLS